ncbi:MAG: hypothetical protein ACYC4U_16510 [Pirellulaceae bacterium]|jgi:hypothetical protein
MLYSFAITPDVFEPWAINDANREGVVIIELLRGLAENGLLANLHNGQWLTQVKRLHDADKASPMLRKDLSLCLEVLHDRHRLVRHPKGSHREDDDDFRWLFWALERHKSHAENCFHGIVATGDLIELSGMTDSVLVPLSKALESPCWQNRRRSFRFAKTEVELRRHLAPLIRYAQVVTLIDPYMSCRKGRFFDTVQHCSAYLGRRDGRQETGQIRIHAGDPREDPEVAHQESPVDRLDRWEQELRPVVAQNRHSFRISLWANKPGGKKFHDRYIITDQCGVDASGGLDFVTDVARANLSGWRLLEYQEIADILSREFHERKGPYKHLGTRDVRP